MMRNVLRRTQLPAVGAADNFPHAGHVRIVSAVHDPCIYVGRAITATNGKKHIDRR